MIRAEQEAGRPEVEKGKALRIEPSDEAKAQH